MRTALYHPWVYLRSGIERMLYELVERSRHEWTIYTHHYEPDGTYPELRAMPVVALTPEVSVRRSLGPLVHATTTITRATLPDDASRALLVSSEGLGDFVMARARVPAACYCHTPLKILHDPVARDRLGETQPQNAQMLRVLGAGFTRADRWLWRRYRHAFVNSNEVARRIAGAGLQPAGWVEVLHPGVDLERFHPGGPTRDRSRTRRFVIAGRVMWQKRLDLGIAAFAAACGEGLDAELVVAGMVDEKSRDYAAALQEQARGLPVTFEFAPLDGRLVELLQDALAVVMTAPNEDFGMVALEAMACGTPVIAVNHGGPRESIVDGKTGWLVPHTVGDFAAVMRRIGERPETAASMGDACRARAGEFGWDRFADRIDDVMEALAEGAPVLPRS